MKAAVRSCGTFCRRFERATAKPRSPALRSLLPRDQGEQCKDGQHRVARLQGRQGPPVQASITAQHHATIRLEADNDPRPARYRFADAFDHVGGSDAGALDPCEQPQPLQCRVGGDRRDDDVRAQQFRGQGSNEVAAQERSCLVRDEGSVCVPVGGDDGIEALLPRPPAGKLLVFGTKRFRVDGDEVVGAAQRDGLCPEFSQHVADDVAADR